MLEIGTAPFEIATASEGLGVQKRGRTTRLTNGSVADFPTAVNGDILAGGRVPFGLPGQPRVFSVTSLAPGLAAAFGAPGDSGSLVFSRTAGEIESTFPCAGLYFAGNFTCVSQQPNPNALTVTGFAFDITAVMNQLQLETVCACVVRSLLAAIFVSDSTQADSASSDLTKHRVRTSERMMRRFRDGILANSSVGKIIARAVAQNAPFGSLLFAQNPELFGLAVEMPEPWVRASTSLQVLQRKIDEKTVSLAGELGERIVEQYPEKADQIKPMLELVRKHEGEPVRKLIGRLQIPKVEQVEKPKQKKKGKVRKGNK